MNLSMLNREVYIQRPETVALDPLQPSVITDDWNQPTQAYAATSIGPIRARVMEQNGTERRSPNQQGAVIVNALIDFAPNEDVRETDRIYDPDTDRTYEVSFVKAVLGRVATDHLQASARLVAGSVGATQ